MSSLRTARLVEIYLYSVHGNRFLIVDEREGSIDLTDDQRSKFSRWALSSPHGVGAADNVLYLAYDHDGLTFRIFEHDGSETLSCGNGLLSIAALLGPRQKSTGNEPQMWSIITEIPSGKPKVVQIGCYGAESELRVSRPTQPPEMIYRGRWEAGATWHTLVFKFPETEAVVTLPAQLIYPGEPHLVVNIGAGPGDDALQRAFFPESETSETVALLDRWARQVNSALLQQFPLGVHLTVMDQVNATKVRYRTWERAIEIETMACGTGALSCAYAIWRATGLAARTYFQVIPQRAAWTDREAGYRVNVEKSGELTLVAPTRYVYRAEVKWPAEESAQ